MIRKIPGGKGGVSHLSHLLFSTTAHMEQETLYIKKLSENATTPQRGSPFSAGYDLFRFILTIVFEI